MGYYGSDLLTNGEHDRLWRNTFKSIPEINKQLELMNKLKYVELIRDAGMTNEKVREVLVGLGKEVGYKISFDDNKE